MRKSVTFLLITGMLAFVACSQVEKVLKTDNSNAKTEIEK